MYQGYKIQIYPNQSQKQKLNQYFNAHIFAFNWAMEQQYDALDRGIKLKNKTELKSLFYTLIDSDDKYSWLHSDKIPVHLYYYVFNDINQLFHSYLTKTAQFSHHRGKPKYKSYSFRYKTFCQRNDMKLFFKSKVQVAKLGKINSNAKQIDRVGYLNKPNDLVAIRFIKDDEKYWVTFNKRLEDVSLVNKKGISIGIDLGLKTWATSSVNDNLYLPEVKFKKYLKKIKLLDRKIEKHKNLKLTSSNRYYKLLKSRRNYYTKLKNLSKSSIDQYIAKIIKVYKPSRIVMEDLSVRSMNKSCWFDIKLNFSQFRYFRDEFEYQCNHKGIDFIIADKFYPSSQICSDCGFRKKMSVDKRIYNCEHCGLSIDRDLNASINLSNYK